MSFEYFCWGVGGSAALEVITCYNYYRYRGVLPTRYRKAGFLAIRALVALIAGGLVVAYRVEGNPILAINIGASAPAILLSLAEGIKTRTAE
jgi:hypothetical protein